MIPPGGDPPAERGLLGGRARMYEGRSQSRGCNGHDWVNRATATAQAWAYHDAAVSALALDRTRDALVVLFVAIGGALLLAAAPLAADRKPVKVTYIGDSVAAAMLSSEEAREAVTKGFAMRLRSSTMPTSRRRELHVNGVDAPNVINTIRLHGRALGRVLVIQVGYNEDASRYAIQPRVSRSRITATRSSPSHTAATDPQSTPCSVSPLSHARTIARAGTPMMKMKARRKVASGRPPSRRPPAVSVLAAVRPWPGQR